MSTQTSIVVVEDEEHLAQGLIFNLEAEGYRVHHEADGEAALQWLLAGTEPVDAIILDVMLPSRDGFSIVQELRAAQNYVPVLMLTARGRPEDILQGFDAGVDDYLNKPFDLSILLARLKGLLRRMHWHRAGTPAEEKLEPEPQIPSDSFTFANRTIDFAALELRAPGKTIHLTLMEADLLRHLVQHAGRIVSRKEILEQVWRVHEDTDTRAIDNFIVRLRRYLEDNPSQPVHLLTVRGVGYRFLPDGAGPQS
jgi:DNA-binding response OmpR family regulator